MEEKIRQKIAEAEKRFSELQVQKTEIESELLRLQGEFRGYTSLVSDEALTIKAEEKPDGRTKSKS